MVNIHRVEFLGEKIVNVAEGQSILEAALEAGIPHFHALHFSVLRMATRAIIRLDSLNA